MEQNREIIQVGIAIDDFLARWIGDDGGLAGVVNGLSQGRDQRLNRDIEVIGKGIFGTGRGFP